jgi:hypothetical protein
VKAALSVDLYAAAVRASSRSATVVRASSRSATVVRASSRSDAGASAPIWADAALVGVRDYPLRHSPSRCLPL